MDRDAPPNPAAEAAPAFSWEAARKVGIVGTGLVAAAAAIGLATTAAGELPWVVSTARLLLVAVGAVTAGAAISMRPDQWRTWAVGAAAAVLAIVGTPAHWDSFRLLFGVLASLAAVGAVVTNLPPAWRRGVVSVWVLFHFGGIFMATTAPNPSPWVTDQLYQRVYNPYLQFLYLRNAYHFYSPEPGPASLLCCLLKTETGEEELPNGVKRKKYEYRWVNLPRRPADVRDPLGLTYYRRLSLTEQIARSTPDAVLPEMFERHEVKQRRVDPALTRIPLHPGEPILLQYRLPYPDITRFLMPSYASHVILENTPDEAAAAKTTVKVYRLEHRILGVAELVGMSNPDRKPGDPYHPVTYRPYFLGEFDVYGNLIDPQEPMLYWLVPVLPRPGGPAPGDPKKKDYVDFLTEHAGHEFPWDQLR